MYFTLDFQKKQQGAGFRPSKTKVCILKIGEMRISNFHKESSKTSNQRHDGVEISAKSSGSLPKVEERKVEINGKIKAGNVLDCH